MVLRRLFSCFQGVLAGRGVQGGAIRGITMLHGERREESRAGELHREAEFRRDRGEKN